MYVSHCDLCLRTKIQRRLPSGELQPLPIPEERWDAISVDFISELPESGGYDSIMVAVDSAGKHSHFIETVTKERWDASVDFISELPESGGYDSIMVAIDSAGKHSHFIETVTMVTAAGAANLYLRMASRGRSSLTADHNSSLPS